jgi:hypothetical protein
MDQSVGALPLQDTAAGTSYSKIADADRGLPRLHGDKNEQPGLRRFLAHPDSDPSTNLCQTTHSDPALQLRRVGDNGRKGRIHFLSHPGIVQARIRRITHKSVGPEARFRYHFSSLFAH